MRMSESAMNALTVAGAVAVVLINLTTAALVSMNALVVSATMIGTSVLTAGAVCLWMWLCMRRYRKRRRQTDVETSSES